MDRLQDHTLFQSSLPPFPFQNYRHPPDFSALERELREIAVLPRSVSPALVGLCRRSLTALTRIRKAATLADIGEHVTREFRLHPEALASKSPAQRIAFARQVTMLLCRRVTGAPFESIGKHFNRDHSTVIHAYQLIERRMARDAAFRLAIEKMERQIGRTLPATTEAAV